MAEPSTREQIAAYIEDAHSRTSIGRLVQKSTKGEITIDPKDSRQVGDILEFVLLDLQVLENLVLALAEQIGTLSPR